MSAARNTGLDLASGKWVMFIDSDDFLPENALYFMIKATEDFPEAQYIKGNNLVTTFNDENEKKVVITKWHYQREPYANRLLSPTEYWKYIDLCRPCCWGYLFLLERIRELNLYFDVNVDFGEDAIFTAKYINHTAQGVYLSTLTYNYLFGRSGSLCNQKKDFSISKVERKLKGAISAVQSFNEISIHTLNNDAIISAMSNYMQWHASMALSCILRLPRGKEKDEYLRELKVLVKKLQKKDNLRKKMIFFLYNYSPTLLRYISI